MSLRFLITIILSFILFTLAPDHGECQFNDIARREFGFTSYLSVGLSGIDVSNLNTDLSNSGYPSFNSMFGSIGGGMQAIIKNKFIIGMNYQRMMKKNKTGDNYRTSLYGSSRSIEFGYIMFSKNTQHMFPFFGIGLQTIDLAIHETVNTSFDTVLDVPGRGTKLSRNGLMLDIGIQFNSIKEAYDNSEGRERRNYSWGVRAGYRYIPWHLDWKTEQSNVNDGPQCSLTGPYITVNFSISSLLRKILK